DPLELVEVVRRDDYTHTRASQREQDLTELTQGDRIEAVRGLIQQQQGDAADQCGRDLDSPALTLGKLVQPAIRERLGSERLIDWRAAQLGEPVEKFCDTQMSLEARALRDVANSVCGAVHVRRHAVDEHAPGGWLERPEQDSEQRRLADALQPARPGDTGSPLEVHAVQRDDIVGIHVPDTGAVYGWHVLSSRSVATA